MKFSVLMGGCVGDNANGESSADECCASIRGAKGSIEDSMKFPLRHWLPMMLSTDSSSRPTHSGCIGDTDAGDAGDAGVIGVIGVPGGVIGPCFDDVDNLVKRDDGADLGLDLS